MKEKCSLMLFVFIITITSFSFAKYIFATDFNVDINSSLFNFDTILEKEISKLTDGKAVNNITIKNYNEENVNFFSTLYNITISGNEKFDFYINDELTTNKNKELIGTTKTEDILNIKAIPKSNVEINLEEIYNIKIETIEPYKKTINFEVIIQSEPKISPTIITKGFKDITANYEEATNSLNIDLTTIGGEYEKLNIPMQNLKVGEVYTLYFDMDMNFKLMSNYNWACTIQDTVNTKTSSSSMLHHEHCTWKCSTSGAKISQAISFTATAETMYWIWDCSALNDGDSGRVSITNTNIVHIPKTTPYVDFPNAYFKYCGTTTLKGTYFESHSYNDFVFKLQTLGSNYEKLYIPIKNLTIGNQYTFDFDLYTSGIMDAAHVYGHTVTETITSAMTSNNKNWTKNISNFINLVGGTEKSTITFTATAETMYWVWEMSYIEDGQWVNINLTNLKVTETPTTLVLKNLYKEVNSEKNDEEKTNEVENNSITTNSVTNTTNTIDINNVVSNSILNSSNIVRNQTTNSVINVNEKSKNNNLISNQISSNEIENNQPNFISNIVYDNAIIE